MEDKKRVKHWEQIFSNTEDGSSLKTDKRLHVRTNRLMAVGSYIQYFIQEIDVLLSELSSLTNGSQVYEGSPNTVLFSADASSMKSKLKKEKSSLAKKSANSSSLAF